MIGYNNECVFKFYGFILNQSYFYLTKSVLVSAVALINFESLFSLCLAIATNFIPFG